MSLDVAQYSSATAKEIGARIDRSLAEALERPVAWSLPGDHLSPTQISMARRCPRQYQERYIHGRKERPAEAPVLGTAVHAALERNFGQKILTKVDLDQVDLITWLMDQGFAEVCYREQEKAGEEILWDTGPEATRQRSKFIVAAYHEHVAPRIQPVAVETSFAVDYGLPVPVEGRFDLERVETTIDFKTGKQRRTKPKEDWRIQAAIYTEATNKPVEFHSLSASSKSGSVGIVTPLESEDLLLAPSTNERAEIRRTIRAVAAELCLYMDMFGPDEPWPTHGRFSEWACNYCGFRSDCPAWKE